MKLYFNALSTYSQKALLAFYEKDVPFEREVVQLGSLEARAAYEKIYPIGKVPMMLMKDGYMVPESTIIIEYLEGHYDQGTRLIPTDVDEARRVRFLDRMIDLYVNDPGIKVFFDHVKFREYLPVDLERARKQLTISYGYLDRDLGNTTWVAGKDFTMADCALIPSLFYLEKCFPFADYANLSRYWKQAQERASYWRVREELLPMWNEWQGKKA